MNVTPTPLVLLSGSTSGKSVKIAATATPGTLIHTAVGGTSAFDQIYLWVTNTDSATRTLTIEYGGTTDPDNLLTKAYAIAANSTPLAICDGLILNGGLIVRAFASVANVVLLTGYVKRWAT